MECDRDMKIVINSCYGGFGLSEAAAARYAELANLNLIVADSGFSDSYYYLHPTISGSMDHREVPGDAIDVDDVERTDPILVQVVEELGSEDASGRFSELQIVEVPDDVKWQIDEYDGSEWVAEVHRTWS
jgi:hypothetical protein